MKYKGINPEEMLLIIKRLEYYKNNEQNLISKIKNSLLAFDNYYKSDISYQIKEKRTEIINNLNTILNNKREHIKYLNDTIEEYRQLDRKNYKKYSNSDIN